MDENQAKFLELVSKYEELKGKLDNVRIELEHFMLELGINSYLQDPSNGLVYKIVVPAGKFIYYNKVDFIRTAKEGERAGTLSKKEAETQGFILNK